MQSRDIRKNKNKPHLTLRKYRWWVIGSVFIGLLLFYDLSQIGGNIRFYAKWVECGRKPVATDVMTLKIGGHPPNYVTPPSFSLVRLSPEYFCTPLEAEQAGYSASADQYEFPHLPPAE